MEKSKIKSYQDLTVWHKSVNFSIKLYGATESFPKQEMFGLTSQLRRAAVSIPSNIAEGFRRKTNKEKLQFLRIAYGSGAEIETQLVIANKLRYLNDDNYAHLTQDLSEVMKMLNTLIDRFEQKAYAKPILSTIVLLLLTTYYILPTVRHAGEIGLAATKNIFEVNMLSGDEYEDELFVMNQSDDLALPVNIKLTLWDLEEESEDIEFVSAEESLNAVKWFTLDSPNFIIDSKSDKQIKFKIAPPSDAALGTYLVMMRIQAVLPEHYFEKEGPRFIPELNVIFFINIGALTLDGNQSHYSAKI